MKIKGYYDLKLIGETSSTLVYRARATATDMGVVIKVFKLENPSPADISQFKHTFKTIRKINLEEVVRVLDLIFTGDRFALVMEDFGGVPFNLHFKGVLAIDVFLDVAIRLTGLLQAIHQRNIIHQDINPENILYNSETDFFKFADVGIAVEPVWTHDEGNLLRSVGSSLMYISPEQTGRMNCDVDYRTDFYSLGVIFYEMLTGGPPFAGAEPMEIVHAHIAIMPVPLREINPDIPAVVSDIVMRLLAKSAESRYQSCSGLLSDLKACRGQLRSIGSIEDFEPGRHDISPKFQLPRILVGREDELEVLHGAFDRVSSDNVGVLLVTGEPGIGKSALVNEIQKSVVAGRGFFITGKYDQLRQSVPYSAIIHAILGLARQLFIRRRWVIPFF